MEARELRSKNEGELRKELTELLQEQFNLRMQKGMGQLTETHQMKRVRRNIARVRTVLHEKSNTSASQAGKEGEQA
jgi:large subunit ribosomal protein L29